MKYVLYVSIGEGVFCSFSVKSCKFVIVFACSAAVTPAYISRVPCTKVLSQEIQIFQETSFCVLQVLLRNFTNTLWQLYIDFLHR